jgi:hypothetical protein
MELLRIGDSGTVPNPTEKGDRVLGLYCTELQMQKRDSLIEVQRNSH